MHFIHSIAEAVVRAIAPELQRIYTEIKTMSTSLSAQLDAATARISADVAAVAADVAALTAQMSAGDTITQAQVDALNEIGTKLEAIPGVMPAVPPVTTAP